METSSDASSDFAETASASDSGDSYSDTADGGSASDGSAGNTARARRRFAGVHGAEPRPVPRRPEKKFSRLSRLESRKVGVVTVTGVGPASLRRSGVDLTLDLRPGKHEITLAGRTCTVEVIEACKALADVTLVPGDDDRPKLEDTVVQASPKINLPDAANLAGDKLGGFVRWMANRALDVAFGHVRIAKGKITHLDAEARLPWGRRIPASSLAKDILGLNLRDVELNDDVLTLPEGKLTPQAAKPVIKAQRRKRTKALRRMKKAEEEGSGSASKTPSKPSAPAAGGGKGKVETNRVKDQSVDLRTLLENGTLSELQVELLKVAEAGEFEATGRAKDFGLFGALSTLVLFRAPEDTDVEVTGQLSVRHERSRRSGVRHVLDLTNIVMTATPRQKRAADDAPSPTLKLSGKATNTVVTHNGVPTRMEGKGKLALEADNLAQVRTLPPIAAQMDRAEAAGAAKAGYRVRLRKQPQPGESSAIGSYEEVSASHKGHSSGTESERSGSDSWGSASSHDKGVEITHLSGGGVLTGYSDKRSRQRPAKKGPKLEGAEAMVSTATKLVKEGDRYVFRQVRVRFDGDVDRVDLPGSSSASSRGAGSATPAKAKADGKSKGKSTGKSKAKSGSKAQKAQGTGRSGKTTRSTARSAKSQRGRRGASRRRAEVSTSEISLSATTSASASASSVSISSLPASFESSSASITRLSTTASSV